MYLQVPVTWPHSFEFLLDSQKGNDSPNLASTVLVLEDDYEHNTTIVPESHAPNLAAEPLVDNTIELSTTLSTNESTSADIAPQHDD